MELTMKAGMHLGLLSLLVLSGCSREAVQIQYGTDSCSYCSMGIMDPDFGAEIITEKGKVYKYDSIECLVKYLKTESPPIHEILVVNYGTRGAFIPAESSLFLISESIKSPMSGNVAAFASEEQILNQGLSGSILDWDMLKLHINE